MTKDEIVKELYRDGHPAAAKLIEQMAEENEHIRQTHIAHDAVKALFDAEGPWRNDACIGYALMAMGRAGFGKEVTRKVVDQMIYCFDDTTVKEAAEYYFRW